jgi:hypothetical protein
VTWPYSLGVTKAQLNVQHVGIPIVPGETTIRVWVPVAPGNMCVPQSFRVSVRLGAPHNLAVELSIEVVEGARPTVVELKVIPHFGPSSPVTSAMLRSIPVEALTRIVIEQVAEPLIDRGGGRFARASDPPEVFRVGPAPGGDATHEAAQIYSGAITANVHNPTELVADQMHVSRSTASRYIREARNLGLLPPARPGRRSTQDRRRK